MSLIELPRRHRGPRAFVEAPAGLQRRVTRALDALGDLPDGFDLPGLDDLSTALIELADALDGDADFEPEPEEEDEEALPLFAFFAQRPP